MIGAIIGDIVGSAYEFNPIKTTDFEAFSRSARFTDDTVLTVALAQALLDGDGYAEAIRRWGRAYPQAGYGQRFRTWLRLDDEGPYQSWGNGSAMRVSPVGWAFETVDEVLAEAEASAAVTHNHPEGVKGAQAVALAIFRARTGATKGAIRDELTDRFGYDLRRTLASVRPSYGFEVSCQRSVPEALIAFFEADDFEGAVRNAVSLGGDADTQAAIAGSVAAAMYEVPAAWRAEAWQRLPDPLREVIRRFEAWAVSRRPSPDRA